MVYWTILFYQVYRNHAKSNGIKPLFFFEAKGLLSQPLLFEKHFPNYFAFQKLYLLELKAIYQSIWEDPKQGRSLHDNVIHSVSLLLSKAEAQEWDAYFLELTEQ